MKRVLIALALLACIGSSVMAQTYRPLTGTKLLLNSTYPSGGGLTLQANPGSDYTLTLPSTAPAANTVLIGSTSGSFDWFTFSNGLSPSVSKTIELGGTLTKNTTIDIGTKVFAITSSTGGTMNINANLNVNATNGAIELISPTQAVNLTAATSVSIGNPSSNVERGEFYLDKDKIELRVTDGTPKGFIGINYLSPDATITLEAAQIDVGGNMVPVTNDAHNLGSNTNRWKDVYVGPSSLHIGTSAGTAELLVGYNSGTNTAYFNVDNASSIFTINKTSGLATTAAFVVGNGDATDIVTVNNIAGANNLTIAENEIKRNADLTIQGSNGTNSTQITLNDDANITSSQGDIFLDAANGGVTLESGSQIDLSAVQGSQSSILNMSPTTSTELKMQDGTVSWNAGLQISLTNNTIETQTTLGTVTVSSFLDAVNNMASLKSFDGAGESAVTITGGASGNVVFKSASADRMIVASDGAIGIGTSSPSQRLHISGGNVRIDPASAGVAAQLQLRNPANTFSSNIQAGAQTADITYTLPTTAPSAGQVLSSATDGTLSWATSLTASSGWTTTGNSGTTATNFIGTTDAKPLVFRTDNVERVRISSDGNVEATSNLLPTTSNNYQVGFDASRWKDVWIGSGAATGLHIGSTNGSAELRVAYSGGTGTFNVDGTSLMTMGATDGVIVTGPLSASGGAVNLNNNSNNAVNIGTGTSTGTITVGGAAAQTIDIGTGAAAKTVSIGSTNTTSTTSLNSGSGGVKVNVDNNQPTNINTGTSTGGVTIGGSAAQTIEIGTGAAAKTVSIGSTNTTSTTSLNSGSGGVKVNVDNNQPTNINTGTSTGKVTVGNSGSEVAVEGKLLTTVKVTGGDFDMLAAGNEHYNVVVFQNLAGIAARLLTLPAGTEGRIIVVVNEEVDDVITVNIDNIPTAIANGRTVAIRSSQTFVYSGGVWH